MTFTLILYSSGQNLFEIKPRSFWLTSKAIKGSWEFMYIKLPKIIRLVIMRFWAARAILYDYFLPLKLKDYSSWSQKVLNLKWRQLEELWGESILRFSRNWGVIVCVTRPLMSKIVVHLLINMCTWLSKTAWLQAAGFILQNDWLSVLWERSRGTGDDDRSNLRSFERYHF